MTRGIFDKKRRKERKKEMRRGIGMVLALMFDEVTI